MAFLKGIGLALIAAFVTVIAMLSGIVLSVISTIVTIILAVVGIFTLVYYLIWESARDKED